MRNNHARYKHGNYQAKILASIARGEIDKEPGAVTLIDVNHDEWCAFWNGKPCNCNPEIITTQYEGQRH